MAYQSEAKTLVALPAADRAPATYDSGVIKLPRGTKGVRLKFSPRTAAGTVTVSVLEENEDGTWQILLGASTTAIAQNAHGSLTVYPGVVAVTNTKVNEALTPRIKVRAVVATANSTFAVLCHFIP